MNPRHDWAPWMLFDLGVFPDEIESRFTPRQWAAVKAEAQRRERARAQFGGN